MRVVVCRTCHSVVVGGVRALPLISLCMHYMQRACVFDVWRSSVAPAHHCVSITAPNHCHRVCVYAHRVCSSRYVACEPRPLQCGPLEPRRASRDGAWVDGGRCHDRREFSHDHQFGHRSGRRATSRRGHPHERGQTVDTRMSAQCRGCSMCILSRENQRRLLTHGTPNDHRCHC